MSADKFVGYILQPDGSRTLSPAWFAFFDEMNRLIQVGQQRLKESEVTDARSNVDSGLDTSGLGVANGVAVGAEHQAKVAPR